MLDIEETIQIHFNSRYANNYVNDSISNCEFYLPLVEVPPQHQIYLSVISGSIPYTFYNIDANNNYLEYFINISGTDYQYDFTITSGNYNVYQLLAYLKSQLPSEFTITYDIITNKFKFVHSTYNFGFVSNTSTALELLGFKQNPDYSIANLSIVSFNKILNSQYCINLQSKHCICVAINYQTGNLNYSNKLMSNILASIPITGAPYSMISYKNPSGYKANLYKNTLSYLKIKIIDQNNNIVDLNGCHWTMTLQMDIVKFVE